MHHYNARWPAYGGWSKSRHVGFEKDSTYLLSYYCSTRYGSLSLSLSLFGRYEYERGNVASKTCKSSLSAKPIC